MYCWSFRILSLREKKMIKQIESITIKLKEFFSHPFCSDFSERKKKDLFFISWRFTSSPKASRDTLFHLSFPPADVTGRGHLESCSNFRVSSSCLEGEISSCTTFVWQIWSRCTICLERISGGLHVWEMRPNQKKELEIPLRHIWASFSEILGNVCQIIANKCQ